jgi:hypothetical protein
VAVGTIHYLRHRDMTTIKDRFTSMKEEEIPSVSVIEPPSILDEVVDVIE